MTVGGALFIAALALRIGWVLYRWSQSGAQFSYDDEALHWQLATNLVRDGALVSDDGRYTARMPVYPLFLAPFALAGSTGVLLARLAQALIGALTTHVAHRFARSTFGDRGGIFAGILVCCDPFAVFFANLLLTEVVFTLLLVLWVSAAARVIVGTRGLSRSVLSTMLIPSSVIFALCGALALLTRPSFALLLPLGWLLVLMMSAERRRLAPPLLLSPLAIVVLLLPWGLRNMAVLGGPAWLSANGGVTLYDAQGPQADGSSDQSFLAEMPELGDLGELERDRVLQQRALDQMRSDPARVLHLAWTKFKRTWSLTPNVAEHSRGATALASAAYTAVVLLAAFVGLGRSLRRPSAQSTSWRRVQALLWAPVVYFTLLHCIYIGSVRYRIPLMPVLAIAAAASVMPSNANRQDAETPRSEEG